MKLASSLSLYHFDFIIENTLDTGTCKDLVPAIERASYQLVQATGGLAHAETQTSE